MKDTRLTFFIPIRHYHADFLRQAVGSILAQTRTDWTLLLPVYREQEQEVTGVVGDALRDSRVRLVMRQGRNLAGAYNTAMRAAETEFIAPLLGDDMLVPETAATLGEEIGAHPGADFFHAGRFFIDAGGRRISADYLPERPVTAAEFARGSPVKHLMCWRVLAGLECGGVDEELENFASDDWDFPWTMLEQGAAFRAVPRALYILRDHRESFRLTTHVPRSVQLATMRRIMNKHGASEEAIRACMREARRSFLRQSLFRSTLHRWLRQRLGFDARRGWREQYR